MARDYGVRATTRVRKAAQRLISQLGRPAAARQLRIGEKSLWRIVNDENVTYATLRLAEAGLGLTVNHDASAE
jgi:hypothetical protein